MDPLHDKYNKITASISINLDQTIKIVDALTKDCDDFVKRRFTIGGINTVNIYFVYIDNMVDKTLLEEDTLRYLIHGMNEMPMFNQFEYIRDKGLRSADVSEAKTMDDAMNFIFGGDTIIFVDGYNKAIRVSVRGMASRGIQKSENEVAIRGSKESFTEAFYLNRVLLRRRVKDANMKIKQFIVGTRTLTDVAMVYLDGVAQPKIIADIEKKINEYIIDGIFDSGMLEQLIENNQNSPFPEIQATERPDKAASAIVEGRVVIIVDNSPTVLIVPATLNSFYQASDDSYNRWEIATLMRILRYIGSFLTMFLPGLYIAVVNYQPELISPALALSFAAAREGVPFSVLIEVVIMEVAFEMLLEAGVRLPGPMGSMLGIVGGLVIGDAAVSANLVSPMVVIIVALTAISAFTIPNEAFASSFRLIRFYSIILSAFLGLYGFVLSFMFLLIHLAGLRSFGVPYLAPYVASGLNGSNDGKDALIRFPIRKMTNRPSFAKEDERVRLVRNYEYKDNKNK